MTSVFEWIEWELQPRACDSVAFIYDEMESQSGRPCPLPTTASTPSWLLHL